jgi:hypothetical protein
MSLGLTYGTLGMLVLAAVGWTIAARPGTSPVAETVLRLKVAAAVLDTEIPEGQVFPEPHGALVPLTAVRAAVEPGHRQLVADAKDGWGRPLLYWSNGDHYMLLSYGADGLPEFEYVGDAPWSVAPLGGTGDVNADVLVVDGDLWRGPTTARERLRRAMADMRSVGTAIEAYSIDFSFYPDSGGFDALSVIESTLEPVYIRNMPTHDPWEEPFRVWSTLEGYAIVTYGSDVQPEFPYETWSQSDWNALPSGSTTEPGRDIVFVNGQFVRWPAQLPH